MVFEALHNLEPRGYVVGWIIAISLLVGILIFLLLAVLLWKVSLVTAGPVESPPRVTSPPASQGASRKKLPFGTSFMVGVQWSEVSAPSGSDGLLVPLEAIHSQEQTPEPRSVLTFSRS